MRIDDLPLSQMRTGMPLERRSSVRLMAVILREDSESLLEQVKTDFTKAESFADAAAWLRKEATLLLKTATRMTLLWLENCSNGTPSAAHPRFSRA